MFGLLIENIREILNFKNEFKQRKFDINEKGIYVIDWVVFSFFVSIVLL